MWLARSHTYLPGACLALLCLMINLSCGDGAVVLPNLTCYECTDVFKDYWDPFTPCQSNLSGVRLRKCHANDRYCKVERVTVKNIVISLVRACANECYYGCRAYGYGVTQLRCTSCCRGEACNTDNRGSAATAKNIILILTIFTCVYNIQKRYAIL